MSRYLSLSLVIYRYISLSLTLSRYLSLYLEHVCRSFVVDRSGIADIKVIGGGGGISGLRNGGHLNQVNVLNDHTGQYTKVKVVKAIRRGRSDSGDFQTYLIADACLTVARI